VTLSIKNANKKDPAIKTSMFKKGMVILGLNKNIFQNKKVENPFEKLCIREFDAEVVILHHATTINVNY
jgi:GTPase